MAILVVLGLVLAACGSVSTAVCGLSGYATQIDEDLEELAALDPALVAQAGTPENATALASLDAVEATAADAQDTLDAATDSEVGPIMRNLFQTALDATDSEARAS